MADHDMNWSVNFEITIDGVETKFENLDWSTQEYILDEIKDGYCSGTTSGAGLITDIDNAE